MLSTESKSELWSDEVSTAHKHELYQKDPKKLISWIESNRGDFRVCNEFHQTLSAAKVVLGGFNDQELTNVLLGLQILTQDKNNFISEQYLLDGIRVTDAVARLAWERKLIDECPVKSEDFAFYQPTLKTE